MAQWVIQTDAQRTDQEIEDRAKHGDAGYEERVRVAEAKADELDWESAMFFAPQFKTMALAMSDQIWPMLRERNGEFWTRLFAKMAGK